MTAPRPSLTLNPNPTMLDVAEVQPVPQLAELPCPFGSDVRGFLSMLMVKMWLKNNDDDGDDDTEEEQERLDISCVAGSSRSMS